MREILHGRTYCSEYWLAVMPTGDIVYRRQKRDQPVEQFVLDLDEAIHRFPIQAAAIRAAWEVANELPEM